ncbi:MAG TPA: hypothetical protein DCL35_07060 [Candidatus Omnitrophica bacterium]|nr:hypothetical protein [Candidatus Omnitrophota bacterium]
MQNAEFEVFKNSLKSKSVEELHTIWVENDRFGWSDDAFKAIKVELVARGADIPEQKKFTGKIDDLDFRKAVGAPFFAVSKKKLIVMSIFTVGFYEIFWFYKNWRFLKEKYGAKVIPGLRAWFAIFFCNGLFRVIKKYAQQHGLNADYKPVQLTVCFILLLAASKLPDPFWLAGFLSFVPLLPVQKAINDLNAKINPGEEINSKFSGWNILGIVLGAIFLIFIIAGIFLPNPPVN